jgi:hypothetical protein
MVLTIIETVSVLAVVIGAIIAVFGAPPSGTLAFAEARVILLIIGPLGRFATWPIAPAQALSPQGDRRHSGVCSSSTDSPRSPLDSEPVFV